MTAVVGAPKLYETDAGVVHALMQARYQNSSRGQFISEDPVFLGDPKQQVLTDPQSLNSYSYANDNPIVSKDPGGTTAYYFDSGKIIFTAPFFNSTQYSESADRQMLSNNAALMQSHPLDLGFFKQQVQQNAPMDYKNGPNANRLYFVNGQLVRSDVFGNYNYGYVGAAAGFGSNILTDAGGLYGIYKWGTPGTAAPSIMNPMNDYDQVNDSITIQRGVSDYFKSYPSSASTNMSRAQCTLNREGKLCLALLQR